MPRIKKQLIMIFKTRFNPAVSLAVMLSGRDKCTPVNMVQDWVAQFSAGGLAAICYSNMFKVKYYICL